MGRDASLERRRERRRGAIGARAHGHHTGAAQLLGVQAAGSSRGAARGQSRSHQPDRSLPREGAGRSRADTPPLAPIGSRWCGAPIWICSGCRRRRSRWPLHRRRQPSRMGTAHRHDCSPRRTTASATAGTGSTWRATRIRPASSTTCTGPTPGAIATTSSGRSTTTSPTTSFSPSRSPATKWTGRPSRPSSPRAFCAWGRACCSARRTIPNAASIISTRSSAPSARARWVSPSTARAATITSSIRFAAKDYYAIQASLFGYVETEVPLAPRAEAEAYLAKNEEINAKLSALRSAIAAIEKPHRDRLELEQIRDEVRRAHLPRRRQAGSRADARREAARDSGLRSGQRARGADRQGAVSGGAREEEGSGGADRGARQAAAGAAADGRDRHRRRPSLLATRRRRQHRQLPEVPHPAAVPGQLRPQGRGSTRCRRRTS